MTDSAISIRRGVAWVSVSRAGNIALQLASMMTLARILPSSDFGLMALAATATSFAGVFRDMGTGAALIQKREIDAELTNAVFRFNALLGLFLTAALVASAAPLARFFGEPRLLPVLAALAPVFAIVSFGTVHQVLLERESRFDRLARVEWISGFAGLAIALLVASRGGGVFALVFQSLFAAAVMTALLWRRTGWRPSRAADLSALGAIFDFSSNVFLFGFVNYFHRNADAMLIGRYLGVSSLGYYSVAYKIFLFPLNNVTSAINRAAFPAYSRNQEDRRRIGRHYLDTLGTIAFVTAPMMALLVVLREPVIGIILGERWLPSSTVVAWLAPVGFFQSMVSTGGAVLNAIGRSDILRNLGIVGTLLLVGACAAGLPRGIEGVAAAYCIANFFWVYPVLRTVLGQLSSSFGDFLAVTRAPVLAALLAALAAFLVDRMIGIVPGGMLFRFVAGAAAGSAVYLLAARRWMPERMERLRAMTRTGREG